MYLVGIDLRNTVGLRQERWRLRSWEGERVRFEWNYCGTESKVSGNAASCP